MTTLYGPNGQVVNTNNGIEIQAWKGLGYSTTKPASGGSPSSNGSASYASAAVVSEEEKRRQHVATLALSPNPDIARIQKLAQDEYIRTGVWNKSYEQQAEAIRKGLNPMYPGGEKGYTDPQYFLGGGSPVLSDFLAGLFGGGKEAADTVTSPKNNGTFLLIAGVAALLLLRR